ncbi:hypothetical protein [Roseovarius sp.]|uniref:hypothetical protein n=1 Tax=Roseovarius sp. TaxID=1486281 RepID=UPI003BACEAE5
MKPSTLDLCSVSFRANQISKDAHAAYWMESSVGDADHLRKQVRDDLQELAALFGLELVEREEDAAQEDAA